MDLVPPKKRTLMEHPTPQQVLAARVNEFTICIKMLLGAKQTLPARVLLYSAIDVFASLLRPLTEPDTSGVHFKQWAEDYLIGPSRFTITSEDLWGARRGLVHTHSPSSRVSGQGQARELHYYRAHAPTPEMQRALDSALNSVRASGKLPVDVDILYDAFEHGSVVSSLIFSVFQNLGRGLCTIRQSSSGTGRMSPNIKVGRASRHSTFGAFDSGFTASICRPRPSPAALAHLRWLMT